MRSLLLATLLSLPTIEGPNPTVRGYLALGSHNCQPSAGATLTRAIVFQHLADPDQDVGIATITACQFHANDPLPQLPYDGYWSTSISTCGRTFAAVIAQWLLGPQNSTSDGGCDPQGPLPSEGEIAGVPRRLHRHVKSGMCHVVNNVVHRCRWS